MKYDLIRSSIPDLVSTSHLRAPGLHVSDVIGDLARVYGYYKGEREACNVCGKEKREHRTSKRGYAYSLSPVYHRFGVIDMTRAQFGLAVEHAFCERMIADEPNRYSRIGEMSLDGLAGNLDLWDGDWWCPNEFKATWQSRRHALDSPKHFWPRLTQLCSYAFMREKLTGRTVRGGALHVLYVNGNYKPLAPEYRMWWIEWTSREKQRTWDQLQRHAETMRGES